MLYVCPTPIGNLEDITLRVLRVLGEVDLILAEDTRRTAQLLHHFGISKPLESFHEHNERSKTEEVLKRLAEGASIALVSDAGMPGISDPGAWLIKQAIEANLPCEILPGANAALVAYLQSGFMSPHFVYYGFLSRKGTVRREELEDLKELGYPIIFYESPHRLAATLEDLLACLGDRRASISRELTKIFAETRRGSLAQLLAFYRENKPRGEFVITVDGASVQDEKMTEDDIIHKLKDLLNSGVSRKTAIQEISRKYRLPRNQIYEIALRVKPSD
ncbi:MAG TPA: 16S rRNA (cytidine(1402)-2'-O)-methyltransferase [Firmicutes bacterium]|nr:16S rRNA (cytidine(1402)-2'-O)-methyltransferase [Bacillota bacterium]